MSEWSLSIETLEGLSFSTDLLERFADQLDAEHGITASAASANTERGVVSATFHVEASSPARARHVGLDAFYTALRHAGFHDSRESWKLRLEIEPVEEIAPPA